MQHEHHTRVQTTSHTKGIIRVKIIDQTPLSVTASEESAAKQMMMQKTADNTLLTVSNENILLGLERQVVL